MLFLISLSFKNLLNFSLFLISNKRTRGKIAKNPTKNLTALNVKGPMLSMPVSWAMNVVPQIKVHNNALNKEIDFDIFN